MSPINALSVLAFASAVVAVPYHGHGHPRHIHRPSGYSAFPLPSANATLPFGSTGFATGTGIATGSGVPTNVAPTAVGPASAETDNVSTSTGNSQTTVVEQSTYYNAASDTICTTDVTVTSKVQVTVTVTADEEASTEAASTNGKSTVRVTSTITQPVSSVEPASTESSEIAPVQETSSEAAPPAYSAPTTTSSTEAAPVETSTEATSTEAATTSEQAPPAYTEPTTSAEPTTSEASSTEAAPVSETSTEEAATTSTMAPYSAPNKAPVYSATSSSAAATSSSPSSYSGGSSNGKRGVAYNDASLTECFLDSPSIGWGYNWGSSSSGLDSSLKFIPQLWGPTSDFTNSWSDNAQSAIDSGSTHLFSFNEPDLSSQCNLSPQEAAEGYKTYMEPFAGKAKLCAPSVTNGGGSMGLNWLSDFMDACSDCTIDCVNIHWYDSAENTEYFKDHVKNATDISGGKQVFVSEFGATGSDDQISSFLEEVMPWMDGQDSIGGYAYFMVSDGKLVSGGEPSSYGKTYAS